MNVVMDQITMKEEASILIADSSATLKPELIPADNRAAPTATAVGAAAAAAAAAVVVVAAAAAGGVGGGGGGGGGGA